MKSIFSVSAIILMFAISYAQNQINNSLFMTGNFNPDSLKEISVSGKIIADSSMMNGMYFLDVNNDNSADYVLVFGPDWYTPDSSTASRPSVGDSITVIGGLFSYMPSYAHMMVVYSINGRFWRSPYDSYWDEMGYNSMMGGMDHTGMGYAFGWNHDRLRNMNFNGKVLVDSTLIYNHYYLDTNNDGKPDYMLNFGPPWYSSSSGTQLPLNGDSISISGRELETGYMKMIIVTMVNGSNWNDSASFGDSMGSGWIHSNMRQSQMFSNPFDTADWMQVNPGWHGSGMMGGGSMMPDSLYCQILEVFPQNVPDDSNQNAMAAFEVDVFYPDGMNGMMQSRQMGGYMNFNSPADIQFHINSKQGSGFNVNGSSVKVKYWDSQNKKWTYVSNTNFNSSNSTVSLSQSHVSNFYIVTANKVTEVTKQKNYIPDTFTLKQNFPNPFNPSTTIDFILGHNSFVNLSVFNILGQKVKTLINRQMTNGSHRVEFNASELSSGIYFYRLSAGEYNKVMKMTLLK